MEGSTVTENDASQGHVVGGGSPDNDLTSRLQAARRSFAITGQLRNAALVGYAGQEIRRLRSALTKLAEVDPTTEIREAARVLKAKGCEERAWALESVADSIDEALGFS
jgi:hypothetical protein